MQKKYDYDYDHDRKNKVHAPSFMLLSNLVYELDIRLLPGWSVLVTQQIFTGIYKVFMGKSECGDFKFMGIA